MSQIFKQKLKFLNIIVGLIFLGAHAVNGLEYYSKKPDFIKGCKIFEPEFTKCSTGDTQQLITHLFKGDLPEISEKLGPLDPMKLEKIVFEPDGSQAITLNAELIDVFLKGLNNIIIKESRVSKKDFGWLTKIAMPKAHLNGKYKMNGKILMMPINGEGNFEVVVDNLDISMRTKNGLYDKGGFTFYNVTSVKVELSLSGLHVNFENLFNGADPEIGRSTNQFFNENWRDLFEALRPMVTKTVETVLVKILKQTFEFVPASILIEDIPSASEYYSKNKAN